MDESRMCVAPEISVIVPVYNVEKFVGRCAESLLSQSFAPAEFIFVDDASPDRSAEIIAEVLELFPERRDYVKVLHHEKNMGLPSARNTGLKNAAGKYIYHCDGDDYVSQGVLEAMYRAAESSGADIVWCDWWLTFGAKERYMVQPEYDSPDEAVRAMLGGGMKFNVWNKMARRSLYEQNNIKFPDGYGMGEDMTMILLFAHATTVKYVPQAFYHYVKLNTGAFSQTYSDRHLSEVRHNVDRVEEVLGSIYGSKIDREIAFLKLETKFPLLFLKDRNKRRLWHEWYPEADKYIMENKYISLRSRLIQWCAANGLNCVVDLYRWLLNDIVYGLIYR